MGSKFVLEPGEDIVAQAKAQLAKGFPQTAGPLYLTDRRLVLEPSQWASMGFGRAWQVQLGEIAQVSLLGRFEGGTLIGGAGRKLAIRLNDNSLHTLSFYLNCDIDAFFASLQSELAGLEHTGR